MLDSLSETAQKVLSNLVTLFLGITIATKMQAEYFLTTDTLLILALGLVAVSYTHLDRYDDVFDQSGV